MRVECVAVETTNLGFGRSWSITEICSSCVTWDNLFPNLFEPWPSLWDTGVTRIQTPETMVWMKMTS